jgi:outer membrane protein assembly factor BamB
MASMYRYKSTMSVRCRSYLSNEVASAVVLNSLVLCVVNVLCCVCFDTKLTNAIEPNWTQFRGPDGMGVAAGPLNLSAIGKEEKVRWRTPIRGTGWSSPVTDGKSLWMTSSLVTEATAAEREAALANVSLAKMKEVAGSVELLAVAVDAVTGKPLWERSLATVEDPSPIHPMNSYASPTPLVIDNGRVVFHFGGYGTWCLDGKTGETIWTQKLAVDDSVGPGSSPVRYKDLLLVACDGIDKQFVAALSLADGSIAWKKDRPPMRATNPEFQKAYCTPLLIDVAGKNQAIILGAQWLIAYEPMTGEEIWRADYGNGFSNTPMPLFVSGLVLFSTGYTSPELVAVDPTGSGDVTATHIKWRQKKGVPTKPSLVSDGSIVYMISDNGILSACSVSDGELLWKNRIGGMFSSSPFLAGSQIVIGSHEGQVIVFATGKQYQEISKTELNEQIMASHIPIAEDLIVRTKEALYRYDARP